MPEAVRFGFFFVRFFFSPFCFFSWKFSQHVVAFGPDVLISAVKELGYALVIATGSFRDDQKYILHAART